MPVKEAMLLIREKFPIKDVAPKLENLADALINKAPPPGQVIRALVSVLQGGFPFDPRWDIK